MTVQETLNSQIFTQAVSQIRAAKLRREIDLAEIPAPQNLAPRAFALAAGVNPTGYGVRGSAANIDSNLAAGRLILLHDPSQVDEWGNEFRIVCYAQADIDLELGTDPFIADVAWSWLIEALHNHNADYTAIAGTATKTVSTGYGSLAHNTSGSQLQLRASWTPGHTGFAAHAAAWAELLCLIAGHPQEGVISLDSWNTQAKTRTNSPR